MSASRAPRLRFLFSKVRPLRSNQIAHHVAAMLVSSLFPQAPCLRALASESESTAAQLRTIVLLGNNPSSSALAPAQVTKRWSADSSAFAQISHLLVPLQLLFMRMSLVRTLRLRTSQTKILTFKESFVPQSRTKRLSANPPSCRKQYKDLTEKTWSAAAVVVVVVVGFYLFV